MESIYLLSKSRFILLFLRSKYKKKEKKNLLFDSEPWNQSTKHPRNYDLSSLRRVPALDSILRTRLQSSTKLLRRWLCGSPPHPCAHPHRRLSFFSKSVSVFPYTDPASRVCECWFSVRVGTRACVGECDWRVCESPYSVATQRALRMCASAENRLPPPPRPGLVTISTNRGASSGRCLARQPTWQLSVPVNTVQEKKRFLRLSSILPVLLPRCYCWPCRCCYPTSSSFFSWFLNGEREKKDRVLRGFHFLRGLWLWK